MASSRPPGWLHGHGSRFGTAPELRLLPSRASAAALVGSSSPGLGCCPGGRLLRSRGLHRPEPRLPGPGGLHRAQGARRAALVAFPGPRCPYRAAGALLAPTGSELRLPRPGGLHAPRLGCLPWWPSTAPWCSPPCRWCPRRRSCAQPARGSAAATLAPSGVKAGAARLTDSKLPGTSTSARQWRRCPFPLACNGTHSGPPRMSAQPLR